MKIVFDKICEDLKNLDNAFLNEALVALGSNELPEDLQKNKSLAQDSQEVKPIEKVKSPSMSYKEKFNKLDPEIRKKVYENIGNDKKIFLQNNKTNEYILNPKKRLDTETINDLENSLEKTSNMKLLSSLETKPEETKPIEIKPEQPKEETKEEIKSIETKPEEAPQEQPKEEVNPEEIKEKKENDELKNDLLNFNTKVNDVNNKFSSLINKQIKKISDKKTINFIFKALTSNKKLSSAIFNSIPVISKGAGLSTFLAEKMPFIKKSTTNFKIATNFFESMPMDKKILLKLRIYQCEQSVARGNNEEYNKMFEIIKKDLNNRIDQFISGPDFQGYIQQLEKEIEQNKEAPKQNTPNSNVSEQKFNNMNNKFSQLATGPQILTASYKLNLKGLKQIVENYK
jgi:hypothetical protein